MDKKLAVLIVIIAIAVLSLSAGCGAFPASEEMVEEEAPLVVATAGVEEGTMEELAELTGTIMARQTVNVIAKTGGKAVQVAVKVGDKVNRGDLIVSLEAEEMVLQLKQAEAGLAVTEANLAAMRTGARLGEPEQGATKENLAVMEAQVKQAKAGVALIRAQLNNASITAPITGLVAAVNIEQGQLAGAGMPVATILNIEMVDVEINVSEANINQVNKGSEVKVLVSAISSEPLTGIVETISPTVNPQRRQFPVKISLYNQEGFLKPGMFARVFLVTAKETDVLKIPKEAVGTDNGKPYVYVVVEGIAAKKDVTLGLSNNSRVQVTSGLILGDEVVVKGQHRLADGRAVLVENGGKK